MVHFYGTNPGEQAGERFRPSGGILNKGRILEPVFPAPRPISGPAAKSEGDWHESCIKIDRPLSITKPRRIGQAQKGKGPRRKENP